MGIPRERQIFIGLGAVAIAGLMVDRVVLTPSGVAASETPAAMASAVGPVATLATAATGATGKLRGGVRHAMHRAFEGHVREQMPELLFGPDASWLEAPESEVSHAAASATQPLIEPRSSGVFPGVELNPRLSLVMPTGRGGMAVIDGQNMRVGEVHPDGYTLIAVDERSVTIGLNGVTARLRLP